MDHLKQKNQTVLDSVRLAIAHIIRFFIYANITKWRIFFENEKKNSKNVCHFVIFAYKKIVWYFKIAIFLSTWHRAATASLDRKMNYCIKVGYKKISWKPIDSWYGKYSILLRYSRLSRDKDWIQINLDYFPLFIVYNVKEV